MTIDPALMEILMSAPPVEPMAPLSAGVAEVQRTRAVVDAANDALSQRVTEPGPEVGSVTDVVLPGGVPGRLYTPVGEAVGSHVYLHGGSFTMGYGSYVDATCRERCAGASLTVLSVDYRKAPENVFPAALDDCVAAVRWMQSELGSVSVGGGSAGGNLAAGVALAVPGLVLALLEVPALDLTCAHLDRTLPPVLGDPDALVGVFADYLGQTPASDPRVSPLLAPDLSAFPPCHVMTAELDPLRGDGEAFLARLREAGVPATGGRRAGHIHPSASFTAVFEPAREWRAELIATLVAAHARP